MMNSLAIRPNVSPKDGIFSFDVAQCKSVLPGGTIDNAPEMVYKEVILYQCFVRFLACTIFSFPMLNDGFCLRV